MKSIDEKKYGDENSKEASTVEKYSSLRNV